MKNFHNHQSVSNVIIMISINKTPIIMCYRTHTPQVTVTWMRIFHSLDRWLCVSFFFFSTLFISVALRAWLSGSSERACAMAKTQSTAHKKMKQWWKYQNIYTHIGLTHQYYHITTILLKHIIIKHCFYES